MTVFTINRLSNLSRLVAFPAFVAALFLFAVARPSAAATIEQRGKAMINSMSSTVISIINDKSLSRTAREDKFRKIFEAHFDVRTIERWVMGRPWRTATAAERKEYLKHFEDYVIKVYTNQLLQYSGEEFRVVGADKDGPGVAVTTHIVDPDGQRPIVVVWRIRAKNGDLKIRDVVIENISMSANQRREFAEVYRQRGNSVKGLIAAIREKVNQLNSQ